MMILCLVLCLRSFHPSIYFLLEYSSGTARTRNPPSLKDESTTSKRSLQRPASGRSRPKNSSSQSISLVIRPRVARYPSNSTSRLRTMRDQQLHHRMHPRMNPNTPVATAFSQMNGKTAARR